MRLLHGSLVVFTIAFIQPASAQYAIVPLDSLAAGQGSFEPGQINNSSSVAYVRSQGGAGNVFRAGTSGTPTLIYAGQPNHGIHSPAINCFGVVAFVELDNLIACSRVARGNGGLITTIDGWDCTYKFFNPGISSSGVVSYAAEGPVLRQIRAGSGGGATLLRQGLGLAAPTLGLSALCTPGGTIAIQSAPIPNTTAIELYRCGAFATVWTWAGPNVIGPVIAISSSRGLLYQIQAPGGSQIPLELRKLRSGVDSLVASAPANYASLRNEFAINAHDAVAFRAVDPSGRDGIFTGANPVADCVVKAGDIVTINSVPKTVSTASLGGINDLGELSIAITFSDGSRSMCRAVPSTVSAVGVPCAVVSADWNEDGRIDCSDIAAFQADVAAASPCADLDDGSSSGIPDGATNAADDSYFQSTLFYYQVQSAAPLSPCEVLDRDGNGVLECADIEYFRQMWQAGSLCADVDNGSGTGARDGGIDLMDCLHFALTLQAHPPCGNVVPGDDCSAPIPASLPILTSTGLQGSQPFNNCLATNSPQGAAAAGCDSPSAINQDLWYSWTAPTGGCLSVTTVGVSNRDTKIAVYESPCGGMPLGCNDDVTTVTPQSTVQINVEQGHTYLIQAGTTDAYQSTAFCSATPIPASGESVQMDFTPAPSNDLCANATPLQLASCATTQAAYDNRCASTDGPVHSRCPWPTGGGVDKDLWYRFVSPGGRIEVSTTSLTGRLAIYRTYYPNGNGIPFTCSDVQAIPDLLVQACADTGFAQGGNPSINMLTRPGENYLVRVGNATGFSGLANLTLRSVCSQTPCSSAPWNSQYTRIFQLRGCGVRGRTWSASIQSAHHSVNVLGTQVSSFAAAGTGACNLPNRVNTVWVANRMVQTLNQARANAGFGCQSAMKVLYMPVTNVNSLLCLPTSTDCSGFIIVSNEPFLFRVGEHNILPELNCIATSLIGVGSGQPCRINPEVVEIPLGEFDGNGNGVPDVKEIADGTLTDANGNGIADAFEGPAYCPADLDDGSGTGMPDGGIDINDLLLFLPAYEAGDDLADLDDGSGLGGTDGAVTIDDLVYFLARYEIGC